MSRRGDPEGGEPTRIGRVEPILIDRAGLFDVDSQPVNGTFTVVGAAEYRSLKEHHRIPPIAVQFGKTAVDLIRIHHGGMDHPAKPLEQILDSLSS